MRKRFNWEPVLVFWAIALGVSSGIAGLTLLAMATDATSPHHFKPIVWEVYGGFLFVTALVVTAAFGFVTGDKNDRRY